MHKEDVVRLWLGQCGRCGLKVRFWCIDGARVTCPLCGLDQEVEAGEMENLTTGEVSEVVLLVAVGEMKRDGIDRRRSNQETNMKWFSKN
jgi:hypothetical protein